MNSAKEVAQILWIEGKENDVMQDKTLADYEQRIRALEALCQTEEEREINDLVIKVVKAIRATLWLLNGGVKYFAGPLGVAMGLWLYGEQVVTWAIGLIIPPSAK